MHFVRVLLDSSIDDRENTGIEKCDRRKGVNNLDPDSALFVRIMLGEEMET